ncbi:uncharacterized protein LTR77_003247 [Saxophila tyrrhenica]|uniref:3-phytase n=1 Tax=Saxophila tyrrhenica TaxID=1690608 RepID=A0AAV9PHQ3_9PEZI|nr:hypothetical protein LTR77_003247 [Saxophila tyrrhenica]
MAFLLYSLALLGLANASPVMTIVTTITTSNPPDYFQTTPEIFQGPTPTGKEPFLRQTDDVQLSGVTYIPPSPLETQQPIQGNSDDGNIFTLLGNIAPYHPSPGFGIDEHPLPEGANVTWVNMIARHGSRYPTEPIELGAALADAKGAKFSGDLEWLNDWKYSLGTNILSSNGRQELYDNGVLHVYNYGQLFNPNQTKKLVWRTTTEDRMRKSAENFAAGFFGLNYADYVDLEFIIDEEGYNNSLSGYNVCENNGNLRTTAGANASAAFVANYTLPAAARLNALSTNFHWNSTWIYSAQQLCSYETVNLGYSKWCALFTYEEWQDFEYSIDLDFIGTFGFLSPTARAVGVGYVEEVLAKMRHHLITQATGSDNVTLDGRERTFPTHQALNFDFSHEVNIFAALTAFGLTQFAEPFSPEEYTEDRSVVVSAMTPFAARFDIEMIEAPRPVCADRTRGLYEEGGKTTYVHFILNQRTIPLGQSHAACGDRDDGWCELETFMKWQAGALEEANYDYACNGDYAPPAYGDVRNGAPPS